MECALQEQYLFNAIYQTMQYLQVLGYHEVLFCHYPLQVLPQALLNAKPIDSANNAMFGAFERMAKKLIFASFARVRNDHGR